MGCCGREGGCNRHRQAVRVLKSLRAPCQTKRAHLLVPQAWLAKQGQSVATLAARRLLHVHILARLALHGGGTHSALQAADGAVLFSRSPRTQPRATPNTAAGTAASRNRATQRNMAGLGRAEGRQ